MALLAQRGGIDVAVIAKAAARVVRRYNSLQLIQTLVLLWAAVLLVLALRDYVTDSDEAPGDGDGNEGGSQAGSGAPKLDELKGNLFLVGHKWCYDHRKKGEAPDSKAGRKAGRGASATTDENDDSSADSTGTDCICETGYSGDDCEVPMCDESCGDHGRCMKPNKCQCRTGWRGRLCDDPICSQSCRHGVCTGPNKCACDAGWTGPTCTVRCEHGHYQSMSVGSSGKPIPTCDCAKGWSGVACNVPTCSLHGCINGKCTSPNVCECDTGWAGPSCKVDLVGPNARNLIASLNPKEHSFNSLVLSKASKPEAWMHMKSWLSFLPNQYSTSRFKLVDSMPADDQIVGKRVSTSKDVAERWDRCAVVGDSAGLLHTQLGTLIDKHAAVMRFNAAPTARFEDHVGKRTTIRLLNRRSTFAAFEKAFTNRRANLNRGMLYNSGFIPGSDGGSDAATILWRPETFHLYPLIKRRFPNDGAQLLRTEFIELVSIVFEGIFDRMVEAGIISKANGAEILAPRPNPDKGVVHGLYRLPTALVGVMVMMQLCRVVNVFGFDPPSQRQKVKQLGLPGFYPYYIRNPSADLSREDMDATAFTSPAFDSVADEGDKSEPKNKPQPRYSKDDNETVSVDAEGIPSARLASLIEAVAMSGKNLTDVLNAGVPGGEFYPGHGGPAGSTSYLYALLRLFEVNGYINLCSTMSPERCLYHGKEYRRRLKHRRRRQL
ncbi:glycosyltransferase family 29 protein [Pseudoscourfieldia marina]